MKLRYGLLSANLLLISFAHAGIPGDVTLETAFPGVSLDFPVALRHAGDGSDRKFIVERDTGQIRIISAGGNLLAQHFLDISAETCTGDSCGERGLLGLAFHPDYTSNGLFYINHTANNMPGIPDGDTVIAEFQVSGNPNVADGGSRRNLLVIAQDFANHNGGDLHFGPDGYLYIGMGDGGSGNDPCNRAQTLKPGDLVTGGSCRDEPTSALLGKMLRIDVDNTTPPGANDLCGAAPDGSAPYAVPADNPFVIFADRFEPGPSPAGVACAETWAYGLRNPYRFSFDRDTGDLFIGDVGQNNWEEVSFQPADSNGGVNFGWNVCEAIYERGSNTNLCTLTGKTDPILWYPIQGQGVDECAVSGGFRYRGPVTSLQGTYVYGDFCGGKVWFATETSPGQWQAELFDDGFGGITGFGEDEGGHLYMLRNSGEILRFAGDE